MRGSRWMDDYLKNTCGLIDSSNVCMCEFTRRVFEDVVFGMYIILYIRTNHWLYNTTQIYLYFMLKQLRYYLFLRSSYCFSRVNQICLCKIRVTEKNFSLSCHRKKDTLVFVSYRKSGRKQEEGGTVCNSDFQRTESTNFTNGNMTRAYRQGEPVHWRLVYEV